VDKALKHTNAYYPNVLKDNEHIYFRLRSRKFIEMIREAAEIRNNTMNTKKSNGHHGGDWYDDVINHDMELDDLSVNNGWDKMDTEGTNNGQADYDKLLNETLTYGRILQAEFEHDPRREVQKSLRDAFALLAYEDPLNAKEVSHLLKREGRVTVAEELNSAILGM
jgi:Ran-binding protein 9/10